MTSKTTRAFPNQPYYADPYPSRHNVPGSQGMTLRDYFAAAALQGQISNINTTGALIGKLLPDIAIVAYAAADAMLKARDK